LEWPERGAIWEAQESVGVMQVGMRVRYEGGEEVGEVTGIVPGHRERVAREGEDGKVCYEEVGAPVQVTWEGGAVDYFAAWELEVVLS
jgi:hypothetical protein